MEKFVYYNELFSLYGSLLTDKNAEIFSYYYEENLSLQEIADLMQVSKSFVGNSIKKCEKKLAELETKLGLYNKKKELAEILKLEDTSEIKKQITTLFF